ncbi:unnamed protein product [Adineta steineri]|uniref:LRAT domain-containing protein n=1 Tax=Adineta steineri TaxID=433720 RepID=A0A815QHB7_9BILA|nr:unnamed protein product [Adineta steineri]CAF4079959.1 unnamed protein product [Adineta steineri]
MSAFDQKLNEIIKEQWGSVVFQSGVLCSPFDQKYALIINMVVWYAVRLVLELDERCDTAAEVIKLGEFFTESGAIEKKDEIIKQFHLFKDNDKEFPVISPYYLTVPDNVRYNPDTYLKPGDFVMIKRENPYISYNHAGIYSGNAEIIHISVPDDCHGNGKFNKEEARIMKTSWSTFYGDKAAEINIVLRFYKRRTNEEVLQVAESLIGARKGTYHFLRENCQHFAGYCQTGYDFSPEVFEMFENTPWIAYKYKLN